MSDEAKSAVRWWFLRIAGLIILAAMVYIHAWVKELEILLFGIPAGLLGIPGTLIGSSVSKKGK